MNTLRIFRILKGWGRKLKIISTSSSLEKLSSIRLSICTKCDYSESKKILSIINGKAKYPDSLLCNKCKCPCLEKSLVIEEKCPLKFW